MTKAEAKRRVCAGVAMLLSEDGSNEWLVRNEDGSDRPESEQRRMLEARDALVAELLRRSAHESR